MPSLWAAWNWFQRSTSVFCCRCLHQLQEMAPTRLRVPGSQNLLPRSRGGRQEEAEVAALCRDQFWELCLTDAWHRLMKLSMGKELGVLPVQKTGQWAGKWPWKDASEQKFDSVKNQHHML